MSKIILVNNEGNKLCPPIQVFEPGTIVTLMSAVALSTSEEDGVPITVKSGKDNFQVNSILEYKIESEDGEIGSDILVLEAEKIEE